MPNIWHTKTPQQIFQTLETSDLGLSGGEIFESKKKYGTNTLPEKKQDSIFIIFLKQFQSPLIYVLIVAGIIILLLDEYSDALIILFILIFNAIIGTFQEGKAQNTLASLKKMMATKATVLRKGVEEIIPDSEVVVGDILILHEGDKVAADARVLSSIGLTTDEASLTGESIPSYKSIEALTVANLPPSEQKNMLFKGTNVAAGSGRAVVVAVGVKTSIGSISEKIASVESEDPMTRDISKLSRLIIYVVIVICGALFFGGLLAGNSAKQMFAVVVSLSISIIPEGLPVVLTLVLATGVWRMSKNNALVKKLQAVEALGQASVIAVDKTGTITKNELTVTKIFVENKNFSVEGVGYEPEGRILFNNQVIGSENAGLLKAAKISALTSNAFVAYSKETDSWQVSGDPTEAALVTFAQKLGLNKENLFSDNRQIAEIAFSYQTKYHAVLNQSGDKFVINLVGAPETVLEMCSTLWRENKNIHLDSKLKEELNEKISEFSKEGLRVIALASKNIKNDQLNPKEISELTLLGFIGMKDVLRPETRNSLDRAKGAGIKVVMITGDHKLTAQAIAKEAGIFNEGDKILEGSVIEQTSEQALETMIKEVSVFARVTPEHKMRIVEAYKNAGEIIAMTGDGVNDAPPLVAADLGVAMGKIGTEVAKEAADIILLDDNFGSIVSAVEEGRSIVKTIKKVILYLFSTNLGEVVVIAGALFLNMPLPLVAAQIIWLNFVTDGFLVVSLGMEPKEAGLLREPRNKKTTLVDNKMAKLIALMSITMGIGSLYLFSFYAHGDIVKAQTISLTAMAVFQWFNAWNCRSDKKSLFKMNVFENKYLIASTGAIIICHLLAVYHPFMQRFLKTTALSLSEWILIITVCSSIIWVEEFRKLLHRIKENKKTFQN